MEFLEIFSWPDSNILADVALKNFNRFKKKYPKLVLYVNFWLEESTK